MKKKIYCMLHTHWDFEWFFTKNHSFVQLNHHMNELIETISNGQINNFLLDAQSILIEEYLKSNPSNKSILEKLVKENKIQIGPWYTQTDLMIIDGESIIKNLQLGINEGNKIGKSQLLGYMPDIFGISKDTPKIFNGFGINKIFFRRGFSQSISNKIEFIWKTMDGSSVKSYVIKNGYATGLGLQVNDEKDLMKHIEKNIQSMTDQDFSILMIGNDQTPVDQNIKLKIKNFNDSNNEYELILLESLDEFMERIDFNKTKILMNDNLEFLDGEFSKIHRSSYSSRYDHKHLMDLVKNRLLKNLYPLIFMWNQLGEKFDMTFVDNIWKEVVQNHAHDSAAACNTDITNMHILNRYINALEKIDGMIEYISSKITNSSSQNDSFTVFNTSFFNKDEYIKIEISTKMEEFSLIDGDRELEFSIINCRKENTSDLTKNGVEDENEFYYIYEIVAKIEIPKLSYKNIKIIKKDSSSNEDKNINSNENYIENNHYKITYDGNLKLEIKQNNKVIDNFIYFLNQADDGDSYDFSNLENDKEKEININANNFEIKKYLENYQEILIHGEVELPYDLLRKGENTKSKYELCIILDNSNLIKFNLSFENKSINHRMRLSFRNDIDVINSLADTNFSFIERPVVHGNMINWKENGWQEEPTGIYPTINYCGIANDNQSMNVYLKGIKEYQVIPENNDIAITLFRSTSFLGKPNIYRRPGVASGVSMKYIKTEDSKMLKRMDYEFAVSYDEKLDKNQIRGQIDNFISELFIYNNQNLNRFSGPLKFFSIANLRNYNENNNFIKEINLPKGINISSIQPLDEKTIILRVHNVYNEVVNNDMQVEFNNIKRASFVDFLNNEIEEIALNNNRIVVNKFNPEQILTIKVQFN